jgi:enterobactin synthetase component D / holo-[acyl-carrier protein] synthase
VIEQILPRATSVAACRDYSADAVLFPEEQAVVSGAVEKRRKEFATGRMCARKALAGLGVPPQAVPSGLKGAPVWPAGIVGSITHCNGYFAAAVAREAEMLSIGIDAEPDEPLPSQLVPDIALPVEIAWLQLVGRESPAVSWDRLLFCMKEAVYKAWYPLAGRWLGFEDASVEVNRERGTFTATLLVDGPRVEGEEIARFDGRWLATDGLVLAAVAMAPLGGGTSAAGAWS